MGVTSSCFGISAPLTLVHLASSYLESPLACMTLKMIAISTRDTGEGLTLTSPATVYDSFGILDRASPVQPRVSYMIDHRKYETLFPRAFHVLRRCGRMESIVSKLCIQSEVQDRAI